MDLLTGFATEMERQTLPPLLDLALNLRNRVMGRAKAMLAFQFMVLPVQDTSNSCCFFFTADIKSIFCDLFSLSVLFAKQVRIPKGEAPAGAVDVKFVFTSHVAAPLLGDAEPHGQTLARVRGSAASQRC